MCRFHTLVGLFCARSALGAFTCLQQDATCSALGDLYAATNGPNSAMTTGWSAAASGTATDYCMFQAVQCSNNVVTEMCVPT